MQMYKNDDGTSLSMAVWLATDNYDHDSRDNYYSVTTLLKPIRQIILGKRLPPEDQLTNISSLVKSRMGTAIHDSVERAWLTGYKETLVALGYPKSVADRVVVNKPPSELAKNDIPVYLEQRSEKAINGYIIGGKFDFVGEGTVEDIKSTGVFTYINDTKSNDYKLQGSMYKWLNPDIITGNFIKIQYVFTDWSKRDSIIQANKGYPPKQQMELRIPLLTIDETERWVSNKLGEITRFKDAPEPSLPRCTDKDLWKKPPTFKYYKKPGQSRATRASDNYREVYQAFIDAGSVGEIKEIPGEVTACRYCRVFPICSQKDEYIASGELVLKNV